MPAFVIPVFYGVVAVAGAFGLASIAWTVTSVEEIVDDTKEGSNALLFGLGILALAFGVSNLLGVLKK